MIPDAKHFFLGKVTKQFFPWHKTFFPCNKIFFTAKKKIIATRKKLFCHSRNTRAVCYAFAQTTILALSPLQCMRELWLSCIPRG